jgi:hypothetical protein
MKYLAKQLPIATTRVAREISGSAGNQPSPNASMPSVPSWVLSGKRRWVVPLYQRDRVAGDITLWSMDHSTKARLARSASDCAPCVGSGMAMLPDRN